MKWYDVPLTRPPCIPGQMTLGPWTVREIARNVRGQVKRLWWKLTDWRWEGRQG